MRRPVTYEPPERQKHLFAFRRYTCDRAAQELLLREFKTSYHLAQIPTRRLWANAAYLELVLWACDLVPAFQKLCLPLEIRHWNIATLRRDLWWLPRRVGRRGNHNSLRIPAKYPHPALLDHIQRTASRVTPFL